MDYRELVQTLFRFDVLNRLPRTGFLMRGIDRPETIGEHIFSASILGTLLLEELPEIDGEKLLKLIALHESGEVLTGDIPAPVTRLLGRDVKKKLELAAGERVLAGFPGLYPLLAEYEAGSSPEARLARAIDKIQMMIKVMIYESEGKTGLDDFWNCEDNFKKAGIPLVDALVDKIRSLRGTMVLDMLEVCKSGEVSEQ